MNTRFGFLMLILVLINGCGHKDGRESTGPLFQSESAKIGDIYHLTKLDKATTYLIDDDTINGISASKDGSHIYVIGTDSSMVLAYELGSKSKPWANIMSPDWKKIRQANSVNEVINMHGSVSHFASISDGILLWVNGKGGIQVKGLGGPEGSVGWKKIGDKKLNASSIAVLEKGDGTFFYLSSSSPETKVFVSKKELVKPSVDGPSYSNDNWNNIVNDKQYKQILLNEKEDVLMIADDGLSIDIMKNDEKELKNHVGKTALAQIPGVNNMLQQCAMLDKYLVCGFIKTGDNTGGLAFYDISKGSEINASSSWKWLNKSENIIKIDVEAHKQMKNKRAIISTQNGIMIFSDGILFEPMKKGFVGDKLPSNSKKYCGAAQDKEGRWYLAVQGAEAEEGGIYALDIKKK